MIDGASLMSFVFGLKDKPQIAKVLSLILLLNLFVKVNYTQVQMDMNIIQHMVIYKLLNHQQEVIYQKVLLKN